MVVSPPEAINELFLEKQRSLEAERKEISRAISELKTIKINELPQSNYKYFEGIPEIKGMWHEILEAMNKLADSDARFDLQSVVAAFKGARFAHVDGSFRSDGLRVSTEGQIKALLADPNTSIEDVYASFGYKPTSAYKDTISQSEVKELVVKVKSILK